MVAVVRLQRLEQGVTVHLESQHGFHVTPGVGYRVVLGSSQRADLRKSLTELDGRMLIKAASRVTVADATGKEIEMVRYLSEMIGSRQPSWRTTCAISDWLTARTQALSDVGGTTVQGTAKTVARSGS
jgi:hypothetical protein